MGRKLEVEREIGRLRDELNRLVSIQGDSHRGKVLEVSQRLDVFICEYIKYHVAYRPLEKIS